MTEVPTQSNSSEPTASTPSWWQLFGSWPGPVRWAAYAAVGVVLLLLAGLVTGTVLVRRPFPQTSGETTLPGLEADVEVIRDGNGIPQLYGDSLEDLMRGQGYVHAQERFYEMDIRRHVTAGRLSELFGEEGLETDKYIRTMGWRRVAEHELAILEPQTRTALQAYADGVNAYLDAHGTTEIAVEYTLLRATGLDYEPEPWTPVDSLAWLKAMAWDLRGNMADEIDRATASVRHDDAELAELYPAYPFDENAPIVGAGAVVDGVFEQGATEGGTRKPQRPAYTAAQRRLLHDLGDGVAGIPELLGRGDGIGSNSWVVDGEHSATGAPLLANDPHLGISMPGIWFQVGLHCRTVSEACPLDVAGFSFSGVPGVVIGHNADIAWGFTNLGPDVTDLYLEKVVGDRWQHGRRMRPLRIRRETIEVRDAEDFELVIRESGHGPLLSDVSQELSTVGANAPIDPDERGPDERGPDEGDPEEGDPDDRGNGFAVALSWTALDPSPTADAILALNLAGDWSEFRAAASDFSVPAQNLVYADREGHIGYQAPGRVPIRKSGNDGSMPSEGWLPENDWTGDYIPFDGLPNVLDPDEGFIVTANQAVIGEDYPYFLTDDWDRGYRSQRIRSLLQNEGELSVEEMASLQLDDRNPLAPVLVPALLDVSVPRGYFSAGQDLLRDWDLGQSADSAAAAYFNVVWRNLLELTFHDDLRPSLYPDGGQRWMAVVEDLLLQPASHWWDDRTTEGVVETRDDILALSLRRARDELTRLQALEVEHWEWGRLHQLNLRNGTLGDSGNGLVEWIVNREGFAAAGGSSAVDATSWDASVGYDVTAAPSMRMVVSLADLDRSRWINLTGASGHPFHANYADQTELWVDGRTLPWAFSRSAVDKAGEDSLTLKPGSGDD